MYAVKVKSARIEIANTPSPPPAEATYEERRRGFGSGDVRVYEMQIGATIGKDPSPATTGQRILVSDWLMTNDVT